MVTDQQVRRLFKLVQTEKNFRLAAMKAGMDEKTARKYRKLGKLPSVVERGTFVLNVQKYLGGTLLKTHARSS